MFTDRDFLERAAVEDYVYVIENYDLSVTARASKITKKTSAEDSLVYLDKWYQEELPVLIKSDKKKPHLSQCDLVKLMKWKLARGKFRPRLVELAASNSEDLVQECTAEGIKLAKKDIAKALTVICKLKGIGPATASAILAIAVPERCSFFADEVALAALGVSGGLKYTQAEYLEMNGVLQQCARRLNKSDSDWGPHRVELAVWAYSMLRQHRPAVLEKGLPSLSNKAGSVKNTVDVKSKEGATGESSGPCKKRKL